MPELGWTIRREHAPVDGFVYVIEAVGTGLYKIGFSSSPKRRSAGIETQSPVPTRLVGVIAGTRTHEAEWHYCFRDKRERGEWFRLTEEDVEHILHESFGVDRLPEYHADSYLPAQDDYEAC
jgi:hypothetical protein